MLQAVTLAAAPITAIAVLGAVLAAVLYLGARPPRGPLPEPPDRARVFLFEGTELVDATQRAAEVLGAARAGATDWARMLSSLSNNFPDLPSRLERLDDTGTVGLRSADGADTLVATAIGNRIRIALSDAEGDGRRISVEPTVFRSMLRDLETLRAVADHMPFPVWRESADGDPLWANAAYLSAVSGGRPDDQARDWPPKPLFARGALADLFVGGGVRRLQPAVANPRRPASWYECRAVDINGERLVSAVAIDATVAAETQLRDFMQTLSNTFSHLATGLAIFDRQRRLSMFNPALTDLTGLPADFLAARPSFYSFLDRMRDRRMLPEPKDYAAWRREIAELEARALDGTYSEMWSLPDNRTYRVTGRPHHGGAMAFLFEDISAEITLTRRFRAELELGQAVFDTLDEAIAVFSPAGDLTMANAAYQKLWRADVATTVDVPTVAEMSRLWMAHGASPVWGEIRNFVLHERERSPWEEHVPFAEGTALRCRLEPLSGGSTLVGFLRVPEIARAGTETALRA